ncbi:hypothetical protein BLAT2472_30395 [Burkholderia latens]
MAAWRPGIVRTRIARRAAIRTRKQHGINRPPRTFRHRAACGSRESRHRKAIAAKGERNEIGKMGCGAGRGGDARAVGRMHVVGRRRIARTGYEPLRRRSRQREWRRRGRLLTRRRIGANG